MHLLDNVKATLLLNAKAKMQKALKNTFFNVKELQQERGEVSPYSLDKLDEGCEI